MLFSLLWRHGSKAFWRNWSYFTFGEFISHGWSFLPSGSLTKEKDEKLKKFIRVWIALSYRFEKSGKKLYDWKQKCLIIQRQWEFCMMLNFKHFYKKLSVIFVFDFAITNIACQYFLLIYNLQGYRFECISNYQKVESERQKIKLDGRY